MLNNQQIQTISSFFSKRPVYRAYLFGSAVRPDFKESSDIDILVDLDYGNGGADFFRFINMQSELSELLGKKIDLVSSNGLSPFIASYIEADKKLVYERR